MKKKLFFLLLACLMLFSFAGCNNFNSDLENAVSEIHEKVLYGKSENFEVTVTMGKIEENFALDGIKNELKDFVSFRVKPLKGSYTVLGISFRYDDQSMEYDLEKSLKFDVWTLNLNGSMNTDKLDIVVFDNKDNFIVQTNKVGMGNFSPLDKLKERFKDELMETYQNGKFNCEVTVRFVKNYNDPESKFYWFVVVHTGAKEYFGLMIDAETGDIVSQKK